MFLVDILRPRLVVELGTRDGVSYCAFCQAIQRLNVPASCIAIGSWQEDSQIGFGGPQVADLRAHHDPLYGSFSRIVQCNHEDARNSFEDASIDLLHVVCIDMQGTVENNLESWLLKMSPRGIILLHDINMRERNVGVWKLWLKLKERFPHLEFFHGHGLGLIAVGESCPPELRALLTAADETLEAVRAFFHALGARVTLQSLQMELPTKNDVETLIALATDRELTIQAHSDGERHLSTWIVDLVDTIARRDESLARVNATVRERELTIQTLTAELLARDEVIESLKVKLEERGQAIKNLNVLGAERERVAQSLSVEMARRDQLAAALVAQISDWEDHWSGVQTTVGWRVITRLRRVRAALAPPNSRRERLWFKAMRRKEARHGATREAS